MTTFAILLIIVGASTVVICLVACLFGSVARYGASDATTPGEPENGATDRRGGTRGYVVKDEGST